MPIPGFGIEKMVRDPYLVSNLLVTIRTVYKLLIDNLMKIKSNNNDKTTNNWLAFISDLKVYLKQACEHVLHCKQTAGSIHVS